MASPKIDLSGCQAIYLDAIPLADVPREIQILPRGQAPDYIVQSAKGPFVVDDEAVRLILANHAVLQNDMVIDYEHQTYTGDEAPAAGWIKGLQDRAAAGIWGAIEWTERALGYLQRKEYRYLSPVVYVRKSDNRAVYLESAALTNLPAIDGMVPIVNKREVKGEPMVVKYLEKLLTKLRLSATATEDEIAAALDKLPTEQKPAGYREKLLARLQLSATATDAEIEAALDKLSSPGQVTEVKIENKAAGLPKSTLAMLGLPETATATEVNAKLMALSAVGTFGNAALVEKLKTQEEDELIRQALTAGKITPAMEAWARQQIQTDVEAFRLYLKTAPALVPLDKIVTDKTPAKAVELDEAQRSINKQMGISDEDFVKFAGKEATV